jgi:hypothetical protein
VLGGGVAEVSPSCVGNSFGEAPNSLRRVATSRCEASVVVRSPVLGLGVDSWALRMVPESRLTLRRTLVPSGRNCRRIIVPSLSRKPVSRVALLGSRPRVDELAPIKYSLTTRALSVSRVTSEPSRLSGWAIWLLRWRRVFWGRRYAPPVILALLRGGITHRASLLTDQAVGLSHSYRLKALSSERPV